MSSTSERLYPRLPVAVQNVACSLYGWREARVRFGPVFHQYLGWLKQSEWWDQDRIREYQEERLTSLISAACRDVPYYRSLMMRRDIGPEDIRTISDLRQLPRLTKEDVRSHRDEFLSTRVDPRNMVRLRTSGTTGKSLHFLVDHSAIAFRWAVWWRHRLRFGVPWGTWHANFTGKAVVPPEQGGPPYWRWNYPMRQALLNMHHMVRRNAPTLVKFLDGHGFEFFAGYPSVIHALCASVLEAGVTLRCPPRFVFTGAENVLDFQRADIAKVTGATITDQYGFSEGCGNASQCPAGVYHEDFEFGILECGEPYTYDAEGNMVGSILATGFASPSFPFIRYDVGDIGVWAPEGYRCPCGRKSRVIWRIDGRIDDYVVTPEGRRIMRFDYLFKDTQEISEAQVVQSEKGKITIVAVARPDFTEQVETRLRAHIREFISPTLDVSFEYVASIPREANGKFRAVRSLLH